MGTLICSNICVPFLVRALHAKRHDSYGQRVTINFSVFSPVRRSVSVCLTLWHIHYVCIRLLSFQWEALQNVYTYIASPGVACRKHIPVLDGIKHQASEICTKRGRSCRNSSNKQSERYKNDKNWKWKMENWKKIPKWNENTQMKL